MHCFSSEGKLKKYNSALEILQEFYEIRLVAYEKRKEFLIKNLKEQINIEESKQKFILAIINNKLQLHKLDDDKINNKLDSMKLYKISNYDYLLNMPSRSLTKSQILSLKTKITILKKDLDIIKKLTAKQIWLNDLSKI